MNKRNALSITADLSEYDLSGGRTMQFEFENKSAQLNMRLPKQLLDAVKAQAKARHMPYTRFIRRTLEQVLTGAASPKEARPPRRGSKLVPHARGK